METGSECTCRPGEAASYHSDAVKFYLRTMSVSGLLISALATSLAKTEGTCSPDVADVSFTTFLATPTSPAVCALTTNEEVTSLNDQTLENCADGCAVNESCAGFNHKNSDPTVCEVFTGLPMMFTVDTACSYYEVLSVKELAIISKIKHAIKSAPSLATS